MPEDTKKGSHKAKNDPKEQRRKRQGRQHPAPVEKKFEKAPEPPKVTEPEKPAYEPPGPEFYQSLKRETDEILKITEEANSKYKKKEIQSNWAKYEMPIESYEEIDEQENLGADYETLIQASFSVGGHFQFKHEKSWDITTGPTPFDKYFDINMESLNTALCTIPFYERNNIDKSLFSEGDIQTMDHRATKYKQKYYNDKKYTTPDMVAEEKILKNLTGNSNNSDSSEVNNEDDTRSNDLGNSQNDFKDINLEAYEPKDTTHDQSVIEPVKQDIKEVSTEPHKPQEPIKVTTESKKLEDKTPTNQKTETIIVPDTKPIKNEEVDDFDILEKDIVANKEEVTKGKPDVTLNERNIGSKDIELPKAPKEYPVSLPKEPPKNPIIESPEDLEKWLDDFLDG